MMPRKSSKENQEPFKMTERIEQDEPTEITSVTRDNHCMDPDGDQAEQSDGGMDVCRMLGIEPDKDKPLTCSVNHQETMRVPSSTPIIFQHNTIITNNMGGINVTVDVSTHETTKVENHTSTTIAAGVGDNVLGSLGKFIGRIFE